MRYVVLSFVVLTSFIHAREFATYGTNRYTVAVTPVTGRAVSAEHRALAKDTIVGRLARSGRFLFIVEAPFAAKNKGLRTNADAAMPVFYISPEITEVSFRVIAEDKSEEKTDIDTNGSKRVTTYRETEYRADAGLRVSVTDAETGGMVYADNVSRRASLYRVDNVKSFIYDKNGVLLREETKSLADEITRTIIEGLIESAKVLISGSTARPEIDLPSQALRDASESAVRDMLSGMKMLGSVVTVNGDRIAVDLGRSTGLRSRVNIAVRGGARETVFQADRPGPMATEAVYVSGPRNIAPGAVVEVIPPVFRPDAMLASFFVPGLGHLANGFTGEGLFYCITESVLAGAVTYCGISVSQKVRSAARASDYDLWKDTTGVALVVTGLLLVGVHTASVIDAAVLAEEYEPFTLRIDENTTVRYAMGVDRQEIGFSIRF